MGCCCYLHYLAKMVVYKVLVIQLMLTVFVKSDEVITGFYGEERDALILFRDSMKSDSGLHGNWTGPPCQNNQSRWAGIGCSNSHVVHVTLESINLMGSLPIAFLHNITFLSKLSLRNNSISGDLPNLTNLVNLEYIFLSGNNFSGSIPLDYIPLPNLIKLELQENEITGEIPPFDQDSLTAFNVSYNHLSGSVPVTEVLQRFPGSSFDHNSGLCGRPLDIPCPASPLPFSPNGTVPTPPSKGKKKPLKVWNIVLIAAAAAIIPFSVMLVFICYYRRVQRKEATKKKETEERPDDGMGKKAQWSGSTDDPERTADLEFFDKSKPIFDLDDLLRASAEVLGKGKLGTTYKATLESGSIVAVKRVKDMKSLSKKEFVQQMQLLGKLRHRNLVEIVSFYYSKEEKLIIYKYVQDTNLFELLHENRGFGRVPLDWRTRVLIMMDVAKGVTYLHQALSSHKVPHGNIKSSNVLLCVTNDSQGGETIYHSKLSDFGYLPLLPSRKSSEKLAIGNCPEFVEGKKLTHKADVYCFGAMLLEVMTGKLPGENHEDLSEWVKGVVNSDWSIDIFDVEILADKEGHEEMLKLTELALQCTDRAPERRPKMSQILMRLEEIHAQLNIEMA